MPRLCGVATSNIDERIRAVSRYLDGVGEAKEICAACGICVRTLRRWVSAYRRHGIKGLEPKKPGPERGRNSIPKKLEEKILRLKQKHPSWGAIRIKYQYDLSCHWRTVHRVI